ncbi:MAG: iron hydrogenase small subunit [Syntrophales bacterium]|nr:iron hydrogenase small subunit [Syntrophales bacterium]
MDNTKYQYIENPALLSRREFLTIGGIVVALLALPTIWITSLVSKKNEYILARTKGLYTDDKTRNIRVSHENKAVSQYYKEFGEKPLGVLSEKLLHTHYFDRTKSIV